MSTRIFFARRSLPLRGWLVLALVVATFAAAPAVADVTLQDTEGNELWDTPEEGSESLPPPVTPPESPPPEATDAPEATEPPAEPAAEPAPEDAEGDPPMVEDTSPQPEGGAPEAAPADDAAPAHDTAPAPGRLAHPEANPRHHQARWEDHLEMGKAIGYGSFEVCEAVSAPLGLIPSIGTAIGLLFEIACLYPGALSMDYVSLFHGDTDSALWEAATAMILAKMWRVATRWIAVGAIGVAALSTVVAGAALLGGAGVQAYLAGGTLTAAAAPLVWAPTLLGTVIVLSGATYIGLRKLRKAGQGLIYEWTYEALADPFESPAAQQKAQDVAYVHPPLSWWERAWFLMAIAGGSDPDFHWSHMVPVVGRVAKAGDGAVALKQHMRRVGKDVVGEEPENLTHMDNTIDTLAAVEGGLGALSEAALIAGAVFCTAGLALTAAYFLLDTNLVLYALATTGIGVVGMAAGGAGIMFLLLREVPGLFRPFLVPLAYGPVPYTWLEEEGAEGTGRAADDDAKASDDDGESE